MKVSRFSLHGIHFEWDDEKDRANKRKHGVDFATACEVLFDPFLRVVDVTEESGEDREAVIGLTVGWRMLYVIYTERENVLRIISARPVVAAERKHYEDQQIEGTSQKESAHDYHQSARPRRRDRGFEAHSTAARILRLPALDSSVCRSGIKS